MAFFLVPACVNAQTWLQQGERLHYDVHWLFFKAGEAELLYRPLPERSYDLVGRMWTTVNAGSLAHLRDRMRVTGVHEKSGKEPTFSTESYALRLNENDYHADKIVTYRRDIREAVYQNRRSAEKPRGYPVPADVRDMFSALYYLRANTKGLKPGDQSVFPVFDLEKLFTMKVSVENRHFMDTIFGRVAVLHVKPVLRRDHEKTEENLEIWVTDDGHYVPVKIKVTTKFGAFTAKLKKVGTAEMASRSPKELPEKGDFVIKNGTKRRIHANPVED